MYRDPETVKAFIKAVNEFRLLPAYKGDAKNAVFIEGETEGTLERALDLFKRDYSQWLLKKDLDG